MTTLIFLLTVLSLLVLIISCIVKAARRKQVKPTFKIIAFIICGYSLLWLVFFLASSFKPVSLGTDVCFDDWCATITKVEKSPASGTDSSRVILHITISNHARGIAQKPSEPRVHIIDADGNYWGYSLKGQQEFEKKNGNQPGIDIRLELGESLQTQLAFAVPAKAKGLKILIEEGPSITKLLFPEDQLVFTLN